jgi:hypothetical protein
MLLLLLSIVAGAATEAMAEAAMNRAEGYAIELGKGEKRQELQFCILGHFTILVQFTFIMETS